jgi:hypothetical protein
VDRLIADAQGLLDTALAADACTSDYAILIANDGAIRVMEAAGWRLDSLQSANGAQTAYRVTSRAGRVRVEGRCGTRSCIVESESNPSIARRVLRGDCFSHQGLAGSKLIPAGN